jgi:hypothetical protein
VEPWADWVVGTDGLGPRYCEANRLAEWVRQPANTWSNAAYALAALGVARGGDAAGAAIPAACLTGLALGSAFFHASLTLAAQRLDMDGAYAVSYAGLALPAALRRPRRELPAWGALVAAAVAASHAVDLHRAGPVLLPALLVAVGVVADRVRRRTGAPGLGRAVAAAVAGGLCWILDDRKVLCATTSLLQWHAAWHVATALAAHELFRFHLRAARP